MNGGMWWYSGEFLCFKSFPCSLPWSASVLSALSHWQNNTECSSPKGRVQFLEASLAFTASSELFKASVCFLEANCEFSYNILSLKILELLRKYIDKLECGDQHATVHHNTPQKGSALFSFIPCS